MEKNLFSRRDFLSRQSGFLAAGFMFKTKSDVFSASPNITASAKVIETKIISCQAQYYHGWPTLTRCADGELLLVYSGGRESHVCPFGRVELMRSHDDGKTWSWPRVLLDGPIDDRDSGVLETKKGTILVTTFTSLAYEPILLRAEKIKPGLPGAWPAGKLKRWRSAHNRVDKKKRHAALGVWMIRSTDGGVTWSGRYDSCVNSPHGPIQLSSGRLLYPGKELWSGGHRVGVCESKDDGRTWKWLSNIPTRAGDSQVNYHELHAVEAFDGRIIVQIRNHNKLNSRETLQCESSDGGKTWSMVHAIGVWGLPSHLLKLKAGRLLMTYGYRRPPYGNRACVSDDNGRTWSEPITISSDGPGGDLGYPSTVQLDNGSLLTAWYESMKGLPHAVIRLARWTL